MIFFRKSTSFIIIFKLLKFSDIVSFLLVPLLDQAEVQELENEHYNSLEDHEIYHGPEEVRSLQGSCEQTKH